MEYSEQDWKNLPDETTPINDERLNHMEKGINDNSKMISIGDESNESKLFINIGNNLMSSKIESGAIYGSTGYTYDSQERLRTCDYVKVESNKKYIVGWTGNLAAYIFYYDDSGKYLSNNGSWITSGYLFTTPNNTSYIKMVWKDSTNDSETLTINDISNLMLNTGDTLLAFEEYIVPSIQVDHNNEYKKVFENNKQPNKKNILEHINYKDYITFNDKVTTVQCNGYKNGNVVYIIYDISGNFSNGSTIIGHINKPLLANTDGASRATSGTTVTPATTIAITNGDLRLHTTISAQASHGTITLLIDE